MAVQVHERHGTGDRQLAGEAYSLAQRDAVEELTLCLGGLGQILVAFDHLHLAHAAQPYFADMVHLLP